MASPSPSTPQISRKMRLLLLPAPLLLKKWSGMVGNGEEWWDMYGNVGE